MTKLLALLAVALVLLASVFANPLPAVHDIHSTTLDLYALEGDNSKSGYFAVRVERSDKIVDLDVQEERALAEGKDVDGTLLAARVTDILFMFEISPKGDVSVDGHKVPVGMSEVKVEADVQTGVTAAGEKLSKEELVNAWDRGLIGMKVFLESSETPDGVVHLAISELITEVNGKNVAQKNALQQLVDVYPDGTLKYGKPCNAPAETTERLSEDKGRHGHHGAHGHKSCFGRRLSSWLRDQSTAFKVFFAALLGASLGLLASAVARVFAVAFAPQPAAIVLVSEENSPFLAKVVVDDADEKLPIYNSEEYQQVASDEKKDQPAA